MSDLANFRPWARRLHWISALIMLGLVIPLGIWIRYFAPDDQSFKLRLYNLHESFGIVLFVLALARLMYRRRNPAPPLPTDSPDWVRLAARTTHAALYALLIIMPISGFLATNAWGFPLRLFELIPLPSPVGKDEALAKTLSLVHWWGAVTLGVLIAAHLAGAWYHHVIRKDGVLRRMLGFS